MNVDVITASAGAGKTYTLAERMLEAIEQGTARPDAIVAITYTNKAAAELRRRLRRRLLAAGRPLDAARVRDGYLGTVHSICQRLIAELAFEAGSSPYPLPAPESYSKRLFGEVVGVVTSDALDELGPLLDALQLQGDDRKNSRHGTKSWKVFLERIVGKARENRLDADALRTSRDRSVQELRDLLDPPRGSVVGRDQEIRDQLELVLAWAEGEVAAETAKKGAPNATNQRRHDWAQRMLRIFDRGSVPTWYELSAVSNVTSRDWKAKPAKAATQGLRAAIDLSHPRLHAELEDLLTRVFDHAATVGEAFVARKQSERLLDFEDMLAQAASVLRTPEARQQLDGQIDLVMVDEFQDTSPVQLEVVLALATLAKRTVWVGDEKQAIFGFQGSDPALMRAATAGVLEGHDPEVLDHNYRSRPPLVHFCSEVFAAALQHRGYSRRHVVLDPACPESPEHEGAPVLRLWRTTKSPTDPKAKVSEAAGIARQLRSMLDDGNTLVRASGLEPTQVAPTRAAQTGDVAVLARTNDQCHAIALALEVQGIPARVAEEGLRDTPEALLLRAGLALLADPRDNLAAAEIAWFTGSVSDPDKWLTERIAAVTEAAEQKGWRAAFPKVAALQKLRAMVDPARGWTPEEAVLAVFDALDMPERALSWFDPRRHFANIEALRAVAREYQDTCAARRSAATIAGLVRYIENLSDKAAQALPTTDDAVRVLTYYKAKGLEWPVVVCSALNYRRAPDLFDVRVQPADGFDIAAPLAGRTLQWWPWPYGGRSAGIDLATRAKASDTATTLTKRHAAEQARLLYVGFTRARDHLILSAMEAKGSVATKWLDVLVDGSGKPVLDLPWMQDGAQSVTVGGQRWDVLVSAVLGTAPTISAGVTHGARWFHHPAQRSAHTAQRIRPSDQELKEADLEQVAIAQVVSLGGRQPLKAQAGEMASVGDAIHGFLAADPIDEPGSRERIAAAMLHHHGVEGQLEIATLIEMSDRLQRWLQGHAPGPRLPEWPVRWVRDDGRVLSGDIDLLVPIEGGWILLDHKSFPGNTEQRDAKLRKWAGQLTSYRDAVEKATGKPVVEVWVHLPVRGEVVQLSLP